MSAIKGIYKTLLCLTAKLVPCIFNRASWQEINRLRVHPGQPLVSNKLCIFNTSYCLINTPGQVYRAAYLAKRRFPAKRRIKQECLGLRRLFPVPAQRESRAPFPLPQALGAPTSGYTSTEQEFVSGTPSLLPKVTQVK